MTILLGLLILSVLVFFHELGHFIFAKIFKVKVLSFSVGMGPVLLHKEFHGTDYRLSLIPLGGYCGLNGEKDFQKAIDENLTEIPKSPDSMFGVHPLKRAMIAFAGPLFNFIIGFLCFFVISMVGYKFNYFDNTIIIPEEETVESPAREAGLLSGDKIITINGEQMNNFWDIQKYVGLRPKETLSVDIERNSQNLSFTITTLLNKDQGNGILGVYPDYSTLQEYETKTYSFFPALLHGVLDTFDFTKQTFKSIGILFKGVDITKVSSGPARISNMIGETMTEGFSSDFRTGLYSTLTLIALISISLGIMNLLPIPIADGGLILFSFITLIFKKEIPPKTQVKIQYIGIAIIAVLFIISIIGDFRYFIDKWSSK